MEIGQKVATNNFYIHEVEMRFGKAKEVSRGIITDMTLIDTYEIATVKLPNGRSRRLNTRYLVVI